MDLNKAIDSLNLKHYATSQKNSDLTDGEKLFIQIYKPEKKLIIYGSLAPNCINHNQVEHIVGQWRKGVIQGTLEKIGWGADLGYWGYRKTNSELDTAIDAFILFSDELPAHYAALDDFEGEEYERILAIFELDNGEVGVGNIYALRQTNETLF